MDDSSGGGEEPTAGVEEPTPADLPGEDPDRLAGILRDGVVGLISGAVGLALMTTVLLAAEALGAFSMEAFAPLARLLGLDAFYPAVPAGYAVFIFQGVVTWPLLFAALKGYLPGVRDPVAGVIFGTVLWTGFAPGFAGAAEPTSIGTYLVFGLLAHWAYGFGVGIVFEYLTTRPESLV